MIGIKISDGKINRLSKNLTTTFEGLGMLNYDSVGLDVSFSDQCRYILSKDFHMADKIGHSKMKNERIIKIVSKYTIFFRNKKE